MARSTKRTLRRGISPRAGRNGGRMSSYAMRWMPSSLVNTILEGDVDKRSNFPCRGRSPEGDGSEKFPKWLYGNALIIN
jgi:hypothetical protein